MKIGVISDIHGNLPALRAVLAKLEAEDCVKILCAGDVVGYGASPSECIELVREKKISCVTGNHDYMVAFPGRELRLRDDVRFAIQWTREQLSTEELDWLRHLPKENVYAGFRFLHASQALYPEWHYVMEPRACCANFLFQKSKIAFNGHTHVPILAVHTQGETPRLVEMREYELTKNRRYLINVGSVGQPRDRRSEAGCVIFNTKTSRVHPYRLEYNIEEAQKEIRESGLPSFFADRLAIGR